MEIDMTALVIRIKTRCHRKKTALVDLYRSVSYSTVREAQDVVESQLRTHNGNMSFVFPQGMYNDRLVNDIRIQMENNNLFGTVELFVLEN